MKESDIQREVLYTLSKIPNSKIQRINNTPIYDPKSGKHRMMNSRYQDYGVSDIFLLYKGIHFAIEVKTPKEYKYIMKNYDEIRNGFFSHKSQNSTERKKARYQSQMIYIEDIIKCGGHGFFTCNDRHALEEVKQFFKK